MARKKDFLYGIIIKFFYLYLCCFGIVTLWAYNSCAELIEKYQDTFNYCDSYAYDDKELDQMNFDLLKLNRINAQLEWKSAVKPSADIFVAKMKFYCLKIIWKSHWCNKLSKNHQNKNKIINRNNQSRMVHLLCDRGPKYSPNEIKHLNSIADQLLFSYRMKKICVIPHSLLNQGENELECFRGEHEVQKLMQISRNEDERRWAWNSWRNNMGRMKNLFTESIAIQNSGARRNGYVDMGECWREEMDVPNVEDLSDNLWQSIKPLYELLHAVVRFQLRKLYPNAIPRATAPIPAHLIGDLWPNDWQSLTDVLFPQYYINITNILMKKSYTVKRMVRDSEDFFTSLHFPPMTDKFWMKSIGKKTKSFIPNCHGAATNMYRQDDFRILGCFEVNEESFRTIHHEMGHVQYFMAYENQPTIYQNGVNAAFHESIGDSIFLGVMTPQHLRRLGLISNNTDDSVSIDSMGLLLKQALTKIPQIPFALLMDKWRWRIFDGVVGGDEYNKAWWALHESMMGIVPRYSRDSPSYFDAAKYHIISNTSYMRYFFATILQFQIFESMCEIATFHEERKNEEFDFPLHECDIYGAEKAGNKLRKLMSMGSSISTQQAFLEFFNTTGYRADSFLKYFQPIKKFLERQIQVDNIPVGWY